MSDVVVNFQRAQFYNNQIWRAALFLKLKKDQNQNLEHYLLDTGASFSFVSF